MQATGTVDSEVGLSYFCKYLLRFGTWDWAVAKHIKDHITRTPGFIRSRARPGQSASWPDLNEPNLRPSWNVFSHILLSLFESWPPLFLHLCCSSSLPLNCMAWLKPINSFIKTSGGRESGGRVVGDHNKHWFFLFYFAFSPSVLRCKFIPIIQALLSLLWNPCPPEDVMNKVGVGTNLQPICFIPLVGGGVCVPRRLFISVMSLLKLSSRSCRTSQNGNQKLRSKQIRNVCFCQHEDSAWCRSDLLCEQQDSKLQRQTNKQ